MAQKKDQRSRKRQVKKTRVPPRPKQGSSLGVGKRDLWIAVGIVVVVVGALVGLYLAGRVDRKASTERTLSWSKPPKMQIDLAKSYEAVVSTSQGQFRIELYDDLAPNTVNNFVFLARQGFYDGLTFHRVIAGFVAQAGDPTGTGTGGPGYTFDDEIVPELHHDAAGIVSMANAGPNTNGSQFFITYAAQPQLDGHHTIFGRVVEGMEVVRALSPRDPETATWPGDMILAVNILER